LQVLKNKDFGKKLKRRFGALLPFCSLPIPQKGLTMKKTLNLSLSILWVLFLAFFALAAGEESQVDTFRKQPELSSIAAANENTNHALQQTQNSYGRISSSLNANINQVWANDGGDKVTRAELRATTNPGSVLNSIWDGNSIHVFGAKNEVVGFNLVLEAPAAEATEITVSFDHLAGPAGAVISSIPAVGEGVFDWIHRNIELFYLSYLEIKGLSLLSYENYDERHIPERFRRPWTDEGEGQGTWEDRPDHDKFYPEIAIPLELVPTFTVGAGQNQSIWVDVYIPKTAPSGLYQGTITVQENGSTTHNIPVELSVRNFILPDLPSARTMVFFSTENINDRYYGVTYPDEDTDLYNQSLRLADRHFQLAHRHKVSLIGNPGYITVDRMDEAWTSRLDGDLFAAANAYDGPGVGVGNNIYVIGEYGDWPWQDGTQADMWANTDVWVNWFDSQSFSTPTDYFLYLIDEPNNTEETKKWTLWMDHNPGPGKRLMSMATIELPTAMDETPSLDIPTSSIPTGITDLWQNAVDLYLEDSEKRVYFYNGSRPGTGSFAIEDDGVALWVLAWAHYKKKIDRWFYWESTYYDNNQGGEGQTNVFQRAQTFGSFDSLDPVLGETGWNYSNGDGVLFYPGTDVRFPAESYDVMGPFSSLRLKLWRRGIQDVDYLTMAAAVNPTRTAEIVNEIIPKVLWEYGVEDPNDPSWVMTDISWSTNPDLWETARAELADIITSNNDGDGDGNQCFIKALRLYD
jgi:Glycoside hydrolase 123, N-terminal domain